MLRSLARAVTMASALALAAVALTGCTQAPPSTASDDCAGIISKVLLTDDSATTVATFQASDIPSIFAIPATPAPTCYYSSTEVLPPVSGIVYNDAHRTLLYIGLTDAQTQAIIAAVRKTVSVKPWTVRFDDGTPAPAAGSTASPAPNAPTSSSARWYYNFSGGPTDDKGEMGYYATLPISQGTAIQAGLGKPQNVLRIETELKQVKK